LLQISYCFIAKVVGEIGNSKYEEMEISEGLTSIWVPIEKAIKLLKETKTENYQGKFIEERDLLFLEKALILINKK
jgi:hypothetical protein